MRTGNFIVTVGLGTPKQDFSVVFDTGSDLTWIQCQPCDPNRCYQQQDPLFDPSKSSSYSNIPCFSTECSHLRSGPHCSSSNCVYSVRYGDKSYTTGLFARETLTLGAPENVVLPGFQFGCGQNNNGLFGTTAGLLGLGRDQVSLVSQSSQKFGKIFKYCLPASRSSTGYLAFGGSGTSNTVKFTPLVTGSRDASFYFVSLEGISVGGQRLSDVTPSVFSASGTIIDSGTVITRLPPMAYTSLRDAFEQGMSKYQSAQPFSLLDTCYDLSGQDTIEVPKITMHFGGGVDVVVDQSGILVAVSESQFCLAFAGNEDASDVAIFGNKQQQTFEVVYDVGGNRLGFGPGGC